MEDSKLLFIPAYNCSIQLERLLSRYDERDFSHYKTILIIDNCSTDDTALKAKNIILKKKIKKL